jgi:hypothetical protein
MLDGLLDYQCGILAPDANGEALAGMPPSPVQRPPPPETPQMLDGILDYQCGVLAPDASAWALTDMPPNSAQQPPFSETPHVIRQALQGMWDLGMTWDSIQRPPPPETPPVIRQVLQGTWEPGMTSNSVWRPLPPETPPVIQQARQGMWEPGMMWNSTQRPPPPESPLVIRQMLQQGTWEPGMPSGSAQRPLSPATLEIASKRGAKERPAPQDANGRKDAVFMPPPAKIPRRGPGAAGRRVKITNAMLQSWKGLGRAGIEAAGGLDALARRENVPITTLRNYLRADGSLTQSSEDRLNPDKREKITDAMLQSWKNLGQAGLDAVGGLDGLARRDNVAAGTLKSYLHANGTLTQRGEDRLNPCRKAKITDAMLQSWKDLGQAGLDAVGGLDGLARRDNVPAAALKHYLRADGRLTQIGEDRLNPGGKAKITDAMLQSWKNLGQAGIDAAGGLNGLAKRDNVSAVALRGYLRADGRLTQIGEDRLNLGGKTRITDAMLQSWKTLGKAGIEAAGGFDGLARRDNVPATALRMYLRADGRLTQRGEDRLNRRRKAKITDAMLQSWKNLGQAGIEAAGGLDGLARRANVHVALLRNYLHADGSLTQRGKDRLNQDKRAKITDAMLRSWKALGKAGIEAAGGLRGVARHANVPAATLNNYLRVDGSLTQLGEDRLNPRRKAKSTNAMLQA